MARTILQRIQSLADATASPELFTAAASICRKLATDDGAVAKAHAIAGTVMKLEPAEQERVLAAVEALLKP